jgi:hypothetical protein
MPVDCSSFQNSRSISSHVLQDLFISVVPAFLCCVRSSVLLLRHLQLLCVRAKGDLQSFETAAGRTERKIDKH